MTDWTQRYLELAALVASWSKDPSTKVGAVIVGADRKNIALGYNGFPPGIDDSPDRLADRKTKYAFTQHAERNVLDNAQFDMRGSALYVTMHPCAECAKSIVSRGIERVVCPPAPTREPWAESSAYAQEIMLEAGIDIVYEEQRAPEELAGALELES